MGYPHDSTPISIPHDISTCIIPQGVEFHRGPAFLGAVVPAADPVRGRCERTGPGALAESVAPWRFSGPGETVEWEEQLKLRHGIYLGNCGKVDSRAPF